MLNTPFAPWPSYTDEEAEAAKRVLLSNRVNYWTGDEGRAFEEEFAAFAGTRRAVAVANGTVALDAALRATGVGPGVDVVVTPRTFVASASAVVNAGARPVFADVDRDSQNLTAETVEAVLTPKTRAVVCVHVAGRPCEMDPILELAKERRFAVVEDCAQAHGALYKGRSVGGLGHAGAWSFCQDKIMTTGGEGGMVTTDDPAIGEAVWSYKDHGKSREAVYEREHPPGFRWVHESFGTNARMTEVQAAIGRIQLGRMGAWTAARRRNAEALGRACRDWEALRVPPVPTHLRHAWYRFYAFVRPERLAAGWDRNRIAAAIQAQGAPCYHEGVCPEVYREAAFRGTGWRPAKRLPNARELGETSLVFLVHPTITEEQMATACQAVRRTMERASR